ncbi:hypothetical protein HS088_TW22G00071 [Tripterygium wilfordii]|uniref:Late embryogenesis abundant protein LEA-2 subgroup domain-containing protein n=1 Tax=Tripterygium wilfordii TaxID=458696 RepID=A0A7J7BWY7_TRIWF|nr:hypothetical protein HS088_TW22G00071 [Tripterygium wilfordii]
MPNIGSIPWTYRYHQYPPWTHQNITCSIITSTASDHLLTGVTFLEFTVAVKAENPNEQIGFIYGKDGSVMVSYQGSTLCSGKIPNFRQPGKNTSTLNIVLKGKSEFGNGLQEALMDNRNSGKIPLVVQVKAPVTVVIGEFPLREIVALVNNSLVVDNLSPHKKAKILSSQITYGFEV